MYKVTSDGKSRWLSIQVTLMKFTPGLMRRTVMMDTYLLAGLYRLCRIGSPPPPDAGTDAALDVQIRWRSLTELWRRYRRFYPTFPSQLVSVSKVGQKCYGFVSNIWEHGDLDVRYLRQRKYVLFIYYFLAYTCVTVLPVLGQVQWENGPKLRLIWHLMANFVTGTIK